MPQPLPKNLNALWNELKDYLLLRVQVLKLTLIESGSKFIADLISNSIVLFFAVLAFLAGVVTLIFYLSNLFGTYAAGFGCATVFFVFLALLLQWRKSVFESFIGAIAIRRYFEKYCSTEKEQQEQKAACAAHSPNEHAKPWLAGSRQVRKN